MRPPTCCRPIGARSARNRCCWRLHAALVPVERTEREEEEVEGDKKELTATHHQCLPARIGLHFSPEVDEHDGVERRAHGDKGHPVQEAKQRAQRLPVAAGNEEECVDLTQAVLQGAGGKMGEEERDARGNS